MLYSDDRVVVLYDKFPKSQHHLLVIARDPGLLDMTCLNRNHVPLLEHMLATVSAARASPRSRPHCTQSCALQGPLRRTYTCRGTVDRGTR